MEETLIAAGMHIHLHVHVHVHVHMHVHVLWFQFAPRSSMPEVEYGERRTGRAHRSQYAHMRAV